MSFSSYCLLASSSLRIPWDREPYDLLIGIGRLVDLLHLDKDGVGFGPFFWG